MTLAGSHITWDEKADNNASERTQFELLLQPLTGCYCRRVFHEHIAYRQTPIKAYNLKAIKV